MYNDLGQMVTESTTYTYDANHNKLSESWSGAMAAWNFVTTHGGANPDGYDAENRFVHFAQSGQSKTFNFTRSDIGNINNINLNGNNTARTFNDIHALTAIGSDSQTFDVDGNLTTSHAGHTLDWDEAGFMKRATVPNGSNFGIEGINEYGYDATQKRVYKKITRNASIAEHTVYIYAGPNCIAEYPAGTAAASPTQEYVYAGSASGGPEIDSLVLLVRGGGSDKYTITRNQQWSVTALAELASGTIVERYTYDHFGKRTILEPNGTTIRATSSYGMPYGYTSRRHDSETDLMYFRARYHDPHTAEFLSPDPLEYVDGMSLFRGYMGLIGRDPSGFQLIDVGSKDEQGRIIYLTPGGRCVVKIIEDGVWVESKFVPCPPDRPVDPKFDPRGYDCWGLAFRTYEYPQRDYNATLADLKKNCTRCDDGKCPSDKLKCVLWRIEYKVTSPPSPPAPPPGSVRIHQVEFHIACSSNHRIACSKNGPGPVDPPKPLDECAPNPNPIPPPGWTDYELINFSNDCFCCPENGMDGRGPKAGVLK